MAGAPRLAVVLLALAATGAFLLPGPSPAAGAPSSSLEEQVRTVASRLRCPVCQNESVADSPSELAAQMRALIRAKVQEGESPDAIAAYFVSRYGEWILLDPPRQGLGWVLWMAPAVVLLVGLGLALRFIRRTVRPEAAETDAAGLDTNR